MVTILSAIASDPGNLNHAILNYTEIRTGARSHLEDRRSLQACRSKAVMCRYRQFDYYRADIRYKSDGGAPYASISLHAAF